MMYTSPIISRKICFVVIFTHREALSKPIDYNKNKILTFEGWLFGGLQVFSVVQFKYANQSEFVTLRFSVLLSCPTGDCDWR